MFQIPCFRPYNDHAGSSRFSPPSRCRTFHQRRTTSYIPLLHHAHVRTDRDSRGCCGGRRTPRCDRSSVRICPRRNSPCRRQDGVRRLHNRQEKSLEHDKGSAPSVPPTSLEAAHCKGQAASEQNLVYFTGVLLGQYSLVSFWGMAWVALIFQRGELKSDVSSKHAQTSRTYSSASQPATVSYNYLLHSAQMGRSGKAAWRLEWARL